MVTRDWHTGFQRRETAIESHVVSGISEPTCMVLGIRSCSELLWKMDLHQHASHILCATVGSIDIRKNNSSAPPGCLQHRCQFGSDSKSDCESVWTRHCVSGLQSSVPREFHVLRDVEVEITVEIGRCRKRIADILRLAPGQTLELGKAAGEPVDIYVNDQLLGLTFATVPKSVVYIVVWAVKALVITVAKRSSPRLSKENWFFLDNGVSTVFFIFSFYKVNSAKKKQLIYFFVF